MEAESTMPPADEDDNQQQQHQERELVELLAPLDLGQRTGDAGSDQTQSSDVTDVQGQTSGFTQHDDLRQAAGLNSNGGLGQNSGLSRDNQAVSLGTPDQAAVVPLDTSNQREDISHDTSTFAPSLVVGGDIITHSEDSIKQQQQQHSIEDGLLSQGEIVNSPLDTPATIPSPRVDSDNIAHSEDNVSQKIRAHLETLVSSQSPTRL